MKGDDPPGSRHPARIPVKTRQSDFYGKFVQGKENIDMGRGDHYPRRVPAENPWEIDRFGQTKSPVQPRPEVR
jgi:hypothetical protein